METLRTTTEALIPDWGSGKAARKAIDSYNSAGKFDILVLGVTIGGTYQTQVAFAEIGGKLTSF